MWCLKKSSMVRLALLTLSFLFVCQDGEAQSKFREYTLDSLRCFDQLDAICKKIIRVLGQPRIIVKFSTYRDCPGYNDFQVEIHERELWTFKEPFEEGIQKINSFLEKYKNRSERYFVSYQNIEERLIFQMEKIVTCLESVSRARRFKKDEWFTVEGCSLFGKDLGEFMCAVDILRVFQSEGLWLLTHEELQRKIKNMKKEREKLEEERARRLEEKSKPPKK